MLLTTSSFSPALFSSRNECLYLAFCFSGHGSVKAYNIFIPIIWCYSKISLTYSVLSKHITFMVDIYFLIICRQPPEVAPISYIRWNLSHMILPGFDTHQLTADSSKITGTHSIVLFNYSVFFMKWNQIFTGRLKINIANNPLCLHINIYKLRSILGFW